MIQLIKGLLWLLGCMDKMTTEGQEWKKGDHCYIQVKESGGTRVAALEVVKRLNSTHSWKSREQNLYREVEL